MWLFGPPDVEKMLAEHDVKGLTKALQYKKDPKVCDAAAKALVRIGEPAVERLIALLKSAPPDIRETATKVLVKIGGPSVAPLIEAVRHAGVDARKAAAEALGGIHDLRAVEPLVAAAQDPEVRPIASNRSSGSATPRPSPPSAPLPSSRSSRRSNTGARTCAVSQPTRWARSAMLGPSSR